MNWLFLDGEHDDGLDLLGDGTIKMLGLWSTTLHARPDERTFDTLRRAPEGISIGGDLCRTRGSLFPVLAHGLGRVSAARMVLWAHA